MEEDKARPIDCRRWCGGRAVRVVRGLSHLSLVAGPRMRVVLAGD
jgi:hypothetical protein